MRLDEADQVDMVLGPGARDRGALADLISLDPTTGAGMAYVRLHSHPDPVRVRAGWVTDADIKAMTEFVAPVGACERSRKARPHDDCRPADPGGPDGPAHHP
jgi:S-DNA-T family DNA segregation ATPase FtsK/SpoIIIE